MYSFFFPNKQMHVPMVTIGLNASQSMLISDFFCYYVQVISYFSFQIVYSLTGIQIWTRNAHWKEGDTKRKGKVSFLVCKGRTRNGTMQGIEERKREKYYLISRKKGRWGKLKSKYIIQ